MIDKAKTYVFGDFRFTPSESLLLRDDEPISLPPKALDVLENLVKNAGSVVTKDDLLRKVWDDMAIEEAAVARTVFLVRTALGDDPKNHAFIQTVPKRGYRFVAEVTTQNGSDGSRVDSMRGMLPVPALQPRRFSAVHVAVALVLVAAVTTGAYFGFFASASAVQKTSVLVMPVTSSGNNSGDELLESGIADALIHQLASTKDITVRPMSVTRSYSGSTTDPIQAGREQKVSRVISASYQRADGKVRIMARLMNIGTGETEDSYKFETAEAGVFAIQDAVAAELGKMIASKLGIKTIPAVDRGATVKEDAYRYYLQGMALFDRRDGAKAVESFERAIELDPNYARAWAGKAAALGGMPSLGDMTSSEIYQKTIEAAERALALDPGSADAHSAVCGVKLAYTFDLEGAGEACSRAMELDPNSPTVLQNHSFLLLVQGRFDDAIHAIKSALDQEPTSFFSHTQYAHALYFARQYDEASTQFARLIELRPDRFPTYEWMIRNLEASGRETEAMEWLVTSMRLRKADQAAVARVQQAYKESGWAGVLRVRIETEKDGKNYLRQAGLHARLGNKDAAFDLLERAYEQRSPVFVTFRVEPQLDPLRTDPRYSDLVGRMESGSR